MDVATISCQYSDMKYNVEYANGISSFTFEFKNKEYKHTMKGSGRGPKTFEIFLKNGKKFLSVHGPELTNLFNDTNKAVNEFMHEKGFAPFMIQKKTESKNGLVSSFKLDFKKITSLLDSGGKIDELVRRQPTKQVKELLKVKTNNICQITGFKLQQKKELKEINSNFFITLTSINYDHRIPLFKGGNDDPNSDNNWMTISEYANREKNKICKTCNEDDCKDCALAFPEKNNIIKPSGQNLKNLKI